MNVNWQNGSWPSLLAVLALFLAVPGCVWLTGGAFDQRCERAGYAGSAHERCVMRLEAGGPR